MKLQLKNIESGKILTVYKSEFGDPELYFFNESDFNQVSKDENNFDGIDQLDYIDSRDYDVIAESELEDYPHKADFMILNQ